MEFPKNEEKEKKIEYNNGSIISAKLKIIKETEKVNYTLKIITLNMKVILLMINLKDMVN